MDTYPIQNSFKVIKELGKGNFGTVLLVQQNNGRISVIKKISLVNMSHNETEIAKREVKILSSLEHPNIVSYKGCFLQGNFLCFMMGFCEGGDLREMIRRQNGYHFQEQCIIRWFIQILMALQYLHERHILHRDLKTQNLFLTRSGLIKVGDFGISRRLDFTGDMARSLVGTPFYMSPEILAGVPYDEKCDIWSLGCCLFELLTLRHPFKARNMGSLIVKIVHGKIGKIPGYYSADITAVVRSLLSHQAQDRPSAMRILRSPFIRGHMKAFLAHTKQVEQTRMDFPRTPQDVKGAQVVPKAFPSELQKRPVLNTPLGNETKILKVMDKDVSSSAGAFAKPLFFPGGLEVSPRRSKGWVPCPSARERRRREKSYRILAAQNRWHSTAEHGPDRNANVPSTQHLDGGKLLLARRSSPTEIRSFSAYLNKTLLTRDDSSKETISSDSPLVFKRMEVLLRELGDVVNKETVHCNAAVNT